MSQTRDQLKEIASEQIALNNLAAASFREMGKAAGIKSSSVHYHFKSRDALVLELLTDYHKSFFSDLEKQAGDNSSPKFRLSCLFSMFLNLKQEGKQAIIQAYSADAGELNEDAKTAVNEFYEDMYNWVLDSLNSARFLPASREALARVVISSLQGALAMDRTREDSPHLAAVEEWINTLSSI